MKPGKAAKSHAQSLAPKYSSPRPVRQEIIPLPTPEKIRYADAVARVLLLEANFLNAPDRSRQPCCRYSYMRRSPFPCRRKKNLAPPTKA